MNEVLRTFENALEYDFRRAHFPQDIDVEPPLAVRHFMGDPCLGDAAPNGLFDQFEMAFAAIAAFVDVRDGHAIRIEAIRIDTREGANAAHRGPGAGAFAVRDGDPLPPFNEGNHLSSSKQKGVQSLHVTVSRPFDLYKG